jgi:hypothetical protein
MRVCLASWNLGSIKISTGPQSQALEREESAPSLLQLAFSPPDQKKEEAPGTPTEKNPMRFKFLHHATQNTLDLLQRHTPKRMLERIGGSRKPEAVSGSR